MAKKLMLRVRPGAELVRAILAPTRELITLDLPTLERPRKAISGKVGAGNCAASVAAVRNCARTLITKCAMGSEKLASGEVAWHYGSVSAIAWLRKLSRIVSHPGFSSSLISGCSCI